jgi:hypothetical protein
VPEFHAEPYVYLDGLTHKAALVAWGAFYFRVRSSGAWKLVDDDELKVMEPIVIRTDRPGVFEEGPPFRGAVIRTLG